MAGSVVVGPERRSGKGFAGGTAFGKDFWRSSEGAGAHGNGERSGTLKGGVPER